MLGTLVVVMTYSSLGSGSLFLALSFSVAGGNLLGQSDLDLGGGLGDLHLRLRLTAGIPILLKMFASTKEVSGC